MIVICIDQFTQGGPGGAGEGFCTRVRTFPGVRQTTPQLNLSRTFEAAGKPFPTLDHRALTVCQDTCSDVSEPFHVNSLSAGRTSLVVRGDGHTTSERKQGNVRQAVGEIRNV